MGDIVKGFPVRSYEGDRAKRLRLYFDTGSPYTFVKRSACRGFAEVFGLAKSRSFSGLGNGRFHASHIMSLEVRLLSIWCRHYAYVVDDYVFEEDKDLLVGHDFMQKFNVRLDWERGDVLLNRASLRRAQKVRRVSL
jgi:hypothetical protein